MRRKSLAVSVAAGEKHKARGRGVLRRQGVYLELFMW